MSDDIAKRLDDLCQCCGCGCFATCSICLAADEIERLRADRDRWRNIADVLHDQVVKTFCWHCGHEWTRDYKIDELVNTYRQAVVDAQVVAVRGE